jgi:hypothetical protein
LNPTEGLIVQSMYLAAMGSAMEIFGRRQDWPIDSNRRSLRIS